MKTAQKCYATAAAIVKASVGFVLLAPFALGMMAAYIAEAAVWTVVGWLRKCPTT